MTGKYTFGMPLREIRPMTKEERQRAKEKEAYNTVTWLDIEALGFNFCVSCGCPTPNTWCEFCFNEE
jgi:hypothetical protein